MPNDDNASACKGCGTALHSQQFAAALDRAQASTADAPAAPASSAPPAVPDAPPPPPPAAAPASDYQPLDPSPLAPGAGVTSTDPTAAQAQINEFLAEQKARKRNKRLIWLMVLIALGGLGAFFIIRGQRAKAKRERVARYYIAFRKVDDSTIADFWRCVVRAKHLDVRLAKDNLILTDGLARAFKNFPTTQPDRLKTKCLPMLDAAAKELRAIKTPDGFAGVTEDVARVMATIGGEFKKYIAQLDERKQQAANEKKVLEASAAFHAGDKDKVSLAVGYARVLKCAIPDLVAMAKKAKKPPNTQAVVEHVFNTCKANPKYADKFRLDCFGEFKAVESDPSKPSWYATVYKKFAGDARDQPALRDCFKRANRGFALKELNDVGKVWVKYRGVRKKLMDEVFKYKEKE
ncbi:MAG: hypothetical protein KC503_16870 [Myxococcales bacterium]|nr:hypothetical protein [Myxococcales bacterium]